MEDCRQEAPNGWSCSSSSKEDLNKSNVRGLYCELYFIMISFNVIKVLNFSENAK